MFCKTCGAELPEGARFCGACGEDMGAGTSSGVVDARQPDASVAGEATMSSSAKVAITVAAAIAVVVFLLMQFRTCDFCGETYFGPGGYSNAEHDVQICNDCAENYHWLGI